MSIGCRRCRIRNEDDVPILPEQWGRLLLEPQAVILGMPLGGVLALLGTNKPGNQMHPLLLIRVDKRLGGWSIGETAALHVAVV